MVEGGKVVREGRRKKGMGRGERRISCFVQCCSLASIAVSPVLSMGDAQYILNSYFQVLVGFSV